MNELLATLGALVSSLGNVQSAGVLREHVALLKTKLDAVKDEFAQLQARCSQLEQRVRELEQQAVATAGTQEFVSHRGAAFKRLAIGGYDDAVYCGACRAPTAAFPRGEAFHCSRCGWFSGFDESEIGAVLAGLP